MTQPSDKPETTSTLYEAIGGEPIIRKLVDRYYELMDTLPEAKACRDVHPPSLEGSAEKLYEYLTGYLGGPQLYIEKRGHPMLRRRHFVAPIGPEERDGWLLCFERAIPFALRTLAGSVGYGLAIFGAYKLIAIAAARRTPAVAAA